jgi:SAM-dependent methyltransferase
MLKTALAGKPLSPKAANSKANLLGAEDRAAHDWYRFVLSFPPHLVRDYIERLEVRKGQRVLDPFCGTGTTLVECKKLGIESVGVEPNPMACFASQVKTDWTPDPRALLKQAELVADRARCMLKSQGISDNPIAASRNGKRVAVCQLKSLPEESMKLLLTDSISPLPLHKTLVLLECIHDRPKSRYYPYEMLALAKALVTSIGNLNFGPEVGVGPIKDDAPVIEPWLHGLGAMAQDLSELEMIEGAPSKVIQADSRALLKLVEPKSIDAVITSPPYPNEKDYTRTTRLESVLLGFIRNKAELQALKRTLVRSNTRNVYKGDDDDKWVASHAEIQRIATAIEKRRLDLGKTSGFERMYPRVARLYFGGMARHLSELRTVLKPGARLAYVVGDQASYLRVMIRTGQLLADIAGSLGYKVERIDLFRTRLATATREQLREEVVVLSWPGGE